MQGIQDCGIRAYASCDGYGIHTNEQTMVEMDDIRANFLEELCQPSDGLGIQCPLIEEVEAVTEKQEPVLPAIEACNECTTLQQVILTSRVT